jgi:hypothetical protein
MFYTLAKTDPALSGKFGLSIDYKEHTVANLMSLDTKATIHNIPVKLYNGQYEFDIRRCYKHYYDKFYGTTSDDPKMYEFGAQRVQKQLFTRQFMFYAPFYCDAVNDMPDSFVIDIYRKDRILSSVSIPLDDKTYVGKYLRSYIEKIDDKTINISVRENGYIVTYYGIDLIKGGLVEFEYNNLHFDENGLPNIETGYFNKKIVMRQIIPLCITFDLDEYIGQDVIIQGYYVKNNIKLPLYNIDRVKETNKPEYKNALSNNTTPYLLRERLRETERDYTSPVTNVYFIDDLYTDEEHTKSLSDFIKFAQSKTNTSLLKNIQDVVNTYRWINRQSTDATVVDGKAMYNNVLYSGLGDAKQFRIEVNPIVNNLNKEHIVSSRFVIDKPNMSNTRIDINTKEGQNTLRVVSEHKKYTVDFNAFFEPTDDVTDKSDLYIEYTGFINEYITLVDFCDKADGEKDYIKNNRLDGQYEYTGITVAPNSNYIGDDLYVASENGYTEYNDKVHKGRLYKKQSFIDITKFKDRIVFGAATRYTYIPVDEYNNNGYFVKTDSLYRNLYILGYTPYNVIKDLGEAVSNKQMYCQVDNNKYTVKNFSTLFTSPEQVDMFYNIDNDSRLYNSTSDFAAWLPYRFITVPKYFNITADIYKKYIKWDGKFKHMLYLVASTENKPAVYNPSATKIDTTSILVDPLFGNFVQFEDNDIALYNKLRSKCDFINEQAVLKEHNAACFIRYDLAPEGVRSTAKKYYKKIISGSRNSYITSRKENDVFVYTLNVNVTSEGHDWILPNMNIDVLNDPEYVKDNISIILPLLKNNLNLTAINEPGFFERPYKNKFYLGYYTPYIKLLEQTNQFYYKTERVENKYLQYNKLFPLQDKVVIPYETDIWQPLLYYYGLSDSTHLAFLQRVYNVIITDDKIEYTLL